MPRLHVCSLATAERLTRRLPIDVQDVLVVISITTPGQPLAAIRNDLDAAAVLRVQFDDVDQEFVALSGYRAVPITAAQAAEIWKFACRWRHANAIIVHCEAGISRSAGVAAALALALGEDEAPFWGPRYSPNRTVYRAVLEAAGLSLRPRDVD